MEKKEKQTKEIKQNNKDINKKIDKIKENISEKTNDITKELKENIDELKEELKEKNDEFKEELEEKSKEFQKDLSKKSKEIKKELSKDSKEFQKKIKEKTEELKEKTEEILTSVKENTKKFDKKDIEENKAMACLAYIIAPVPYFVEDKSKWVRYHAIQGMNLFILTVLYALSVSIISSVFLFDFPILKAILKASLYAFMIIYALIGIITVCNEQAKELPLIGKFKFIKK